MTAASADRKPQGKTPFGRCGFPLGWYDFGLGDKVVVKGRLGSRSVEWLVGLLIIVASLSFDSAGEEARFVGCDMSACVYAIYLIFKNAKKGGRARH